MAGYLNGLQQLLIVARNGLPIPKNTLISRIELLARIKEIYSDATALYGEPKPYEAKAGGKEHAAWNQIHRHIQESISSFIPPKVALYHEHIDPSSLVILAPEATYRLPLLKPDEVQVEYVQERSLVMFRRRPVRKTASIPLSAATY